MFRDHSRHVRLNVKEPDEDEDESFQLKSGNKVLELLVEKVYKKRLFYVCLVSTLLFAGIVALRLTVNTDKLDRFVNEHGEIVIHKNIPLTRDQMFRRHFSRYYGNRRGYYRYHGQRIDEIFDGTVVTKDTVTKETVTKTTTADSGVKDSIVNETVNDKNVTITDVTDNGYNNSHILVNATIFETKNTNVSVNVTEIFSSSTLRDQTATTNDSVTANSSVPYLSTLEPDENLSLPRIVPMATEEISNVSMETPVETTSISSRNNSINPDLNINSSLSYANNQITNNILVSLATKHVFKEINESDILTTTETPNANGTKRTALIESENLMTSSGDDDVTSGAVT